MDNNTKTIPIPNNQHHQHVSRQNSRKSALNPQTVVYSVNLTVIIIVALVGLCITYVSHSYLAIISSNNYQQDTGEKKISTAYEQQHNGQHLAFFPSDVSWFSYNKKAECLHLQSNEFLGSRSSLDAHTLQTVKKKLEVKASVQAEAKASYKAAEDMMLQGKGEKARKLLQHAMLLDPLDPDILNAYGEFVEPTDLVLADHMFNQAIVVSPGHTRALMNLQRTSPIVQQMDSTLYQRIDSKRDVLIHFPESHPGLRRLKRELYYQHIYHTIAIEGNTLNLHQTRAIIETRVAIGGKSLLEQNEVLGMDAALSYINSTLINRIGKITLSDILEIHRRVLGFNDPVEAGQLRNTQVFVGDFIPPQPGEVQALMDEFIDWLNAEDTLRLHPIRLSAIAHYRLVTIHPFYDGNGRTSRLLMNLILMNAGYPPVMIRVEDRHEYYKHLETSNQGDIRPFIRFIAKCTEQTLDEYIRAVSEDSRKIRNVAERDYDDGRTIIIDHDNASDP